MSLFANRPELFRDIWPTTDTVQDVRRLCSQLQLLSLRASLRLQQANIAAASPEGATADIFERFFTYPGLEEIVNDPEFSFWYARFRAAGPSPQELEGVLADFGRFHILPLLRSGQAAELLVQLDNTGELRLPRLPVRLAFGPELKGVRLAASIQAGPALEDRRALMRALEEASRGESPRLIFMFSETTRRLFPSLSVSPQVADITVLGENQLLKETIARISNGAARMVALADTAIPNDVAEALAELERVAPKFRDGVQAIVQGVAPIESRVVYSTSESTLPGIVFVRLHPGNWLWNAELILHEAAHNWLVMLMRLDSLINPTRDRYRSPWRSDLRPMRGILAGTHAFLLVTEYMIEKWKQRHEPLAPIAQRAILEHRRAQLGLRKLQRYAKWTQAGGVFAERLQEHAVRLTAEIADLKSSSKVWRRERVPYEWPCLLDD